MPCDLAGRSNDVARLLSADAPPLNVIPRGDMANTRLDVSHGRILPRAGTWQATVQASCVTNSIASPLHL
jgi:hypothetical protein